MKTKANYLILALCALMLSFVSCTKEDSGIMDVKESSVKIQLSLENEMGTKAISDGKGANQLMYAIFDEENNLIIEKQVQENPTGLTSAGGYSTNLTLPNGHVYTAVFWAQNSACSAYTVSNDMKVSINYEGVNNDETRDAFFAAKTFTVEPNKTVSVVLKRPFAQINVGAFPFDYEHVVEAGITITKSSAVIKNVPDQINLLDGTVSGEAEVQYSFGTIPAEDLTVDVDGNGQKEVYKWISMSYMLADIEERSTTYEMSFQFCDETGKDVIDFNEGLGSVPATRNWRTNIVGQILTGSVSINITIDPIYENETINSAGLYYNFSEDTEIKDKVFAFNTYEAATFTSENNNLVNVENVTFSGKVQFIAFGEYRDKGNYVDFRNELTNVKAQDMVVTHSVGIANVETIDYMAPLIFLRGVNTLTNCEFTGTTSTAPDKKDYNGNYHPVIAYDCGVPNKCEATFNKCKVDNLYAWSHSQITLNNTKVKYIRCSTHKKSKSSSHLTIGSGTEVDEIFVSSTGLAKFVNIDGKKTLTADLWSPCIIIKAGAKVKKLDYNGRTNEDVVIEEGAIVEEIVNLGE